MTSEKKVHHWNENDRGAPHHFQYAKDNLGQRAQGGSVPEGMVQGWINKDGTYDAEGPEHLQELATGRLGLMDPSDDWSFGAHVTSGIQQHSAANIAQDRAGDARSVRLIKGWLLLG